MASSPGGPCVSAREMDLCGRLLAGQRQEETLWRQKSRITWLRTLDLNTKIFDLSTLVRRQRNCIEALKKDTGEVVTE